MGAASHYQQTYQATDKLIRSSLLTRAETKLRGGHGGNSRKAQGSRWTGGMFGFAPCFLKKRKQNGNKGGALGPRSATPAKKPRGAAKVLHEGRSEVSPEQAGGRREGT